MFTTYACVAHSTIGMIKFLIERNYSLLLSMHASSKTTMINTHAAVIVGLRIYDRNKTVCG